MEGRLFKTLGLHFGMRFPDTAPEYATVINETPLVLQLDLDEKIQLHYTDGDFTVNDQLVLHIGDRVVICQMKTKHHYSVQYRVGNALGISVTGDPALAVGVARATDRTGAASAGTAHDHQTSSTGSDKAKVE